MIKKTWRLSIKNKTDEDGEKMEIGFLNYDILEWGTLELLILSLIFGVVIGLIAYFVCREFGLEWLGIIIAGIMIIPALIYLILYYFGYIEFDFNRPSLPW